eukprot:TRINITY_DN21773_c0_g1_i1.p1 TRINITY_DN21773_c0_g1~~TRINITY_DN21773_c0_g1_i1.p1  ORF type:complete len:645 (+),score=101.28 TRINITY_DN21773_c0_g1_i1:58-1992(+)
MMQRRPRGSGNSQVATAVLIVVLGTIMNFYWGWVRERRCKMEAQRLFDELSKNNKAQPCEECVCPECECNQEHHQLHQQQEVEEADQQQQQQQQQHTAALTSAEFECPYDCSGHGSCNKKTGNCNCKKGHTGKGCTLPEETSPADLVTVLLPSSLENADTISSKIKKEYDSIKVVVGSSLPTKKRSTLGSELQALLETVETDLVLIGSDLKDWGPYSNLTMIVEMFQQTDVDILGGLEDRNGLLSTPCYDIVHARWLLRYKKPSFGYQRHERFVMYCDSTSHTFVAKTVVLRDTLKGFNATFDGLAVADVIIRAHTHNEKLIYNNQNPSLKNIPTRLPGYIMVGTGSEIIYPTASDPYVKEEFTREFAEVHQIEAYFDQTGHLHPIQCVKTGGNLQHSVDGRYSPLCHRMTRQRDFVFIHDLWTDNNWAIPSGVDEPKRLKYAVSIHHGNLFGAMRMGEELFWETDGDIDLVSFNLTNPQLVERGRELIEKLKSVGFSVTMPHRKMTYLNVLRNKTDFQISLRSTKDPMTAGKPPHKHRIHVLYQGRKVYVNGFQNPWYGIKADKGHDYREQYLAQQPWVLHFTKDSISCIAGFHNACLPPCSSPEWIADHNYCSDVIDPAYRNPYLWGRNDEAEWERQVNRFR